MSKERTDDELLRQGTIGRVTVELPTGAQLEAKVLDYFDAIELLDLLEKCEAGEMSALREFGPKLATSIGVKKEDLKGVTLGELFELARYFFAYRRTETPETVMWKNIEEANAKRLSRTLSRTSPPSTGSPNEATA